MAYTGSLRRIDCRGVLLQAFADAECADQHQHVATLQCLLQTGAVIEVGGTHAGTARSCIRKAGRIARQQDQVGGGTSLQQKIGDAPAEIAGGTADDDFHGGRFLLFLWRGL